MQGLKFLRFLMFIKSLKIIIQPFGFRHIQLSSNINTLVTLQNATMRKIFTRQVQYRYYAKAKPNDITNVGKLMYHQPLSHAVLDYKHPHTMFA